MRFFKKANLFLLLLFLCIPGSSYAEVTKEQLKAVYLYNFLSFVKWENNTEVNICVIGNKEVSDLLEQIHQKQASPIPFIVRPLTNAKDISSCQIAFLDGSQDKHLKNFITNSQSQTSLTVSDSPGFAKQGGVIEFVQRNNNLKLQINLTNAKKRKLKISSRLLKVSEVVE